MIRRLAATFIALVALFGDYSVRSVDVAEGWASTPVNAAIFRRNSLWTHENEQYISFYNAEGSMVLGKRKLAAGDWTLNDTGYHGNVRDAHNIISMAVDGDGFLHVAFDHHDDSLHYCRSIAPGSLELGPMESMVGFNEIDVTYPEFYSMPDSDLLFVYRSGGSGHGDMVINRYSTAEQKWTNVQDVLIDGEVRRSAYWQLCVDSGGTIHLSWVWRETMEVETNHDLCYARSRDGGVTWESSKGEQYQLPITQETAEVVWPVPQGQDLINQTSMTADSEGHPYIATNWRDGDSDTPRYRIVWNDGEVWRQSVVPGSDTPFQLGRGGEVPVSRPQLVVDDGRAIMIFRSAARGNRVTIASTKDIRKGKWTLHDITGYSVHSWEPTLDSELWRQSGRLHILVQDCGPDADTPASMIKVLEVSK